VKHESRSPNLAVYGVNWWRSWNRKPTDEKAARHLDEVVV
jgi:hypothetical protein